MAAKNTATALAIQAEILSDAAEDMRTAGDLYKLVRLQDLARELDDIAATMRAQARDTEVQD